MIHRSLDQIKRPHDIVFPIQTRFLHAFAHLTKGGKMHHRDGGIFFENTINVQSFHQITPFKRPKFNGALPASDQIIESYRHITRLLQRLAGMRADITGATSHQNILFIHGYIRKPSILFGRYLSIKKSLNNNTPLTSSAFPTRVNIIVPNDVILTKVAPSLHFD